MARSERQDSNIIVYADNDSTVYLLNTGVGGGPIATGTQFTVVDNLNIAATKNITVSGPISGGNATISSNGGSASFTWTGSAYSQVVPSGVPSSGGITSLTGDVTAGPGSGSQAATLAAGNAGHLNSGTLLAARMPALTGDVTTTVGTVATTLATVNSNVGSFTSANITVNAKGLVTAAANGSGGSSSLLVPWWWDFNHQNYSSVEILYVANVAMRVTGIIGRVEVANGSALTLTINKAPSGTAIDAGIALASSLDTNGTAATNQVLTLSSTPSDLLLAIGDCIGVILSTAGNVGQGCISIYLTPQ